MQSFVSQDFELHWRLFDEMMNRFKLNANETAKAAGVSRVLLSRFRHGKADLGGAKLMALILNLPPEPRAWYLSQLFGYSPDVSLRALLAKARPEEQAEALTLIAELVVRNHHQALRTDELAKAG
ncbi:MAG: XRE family transcriptional regulator [Calothrix sp. SM1_7_51]|nr:XRE family transcriptional regulator [Calothrix sp. SM1_7_51]